MQYSTFLRCSFQNAPDAITSAFDGQMQKPIMNDESINYYSEFEAPPHLYLYLCITIAISRTVIKVKWN